MEPDLIIVLSVLPVVVVLFVTEALRIDVVALLAMLTLTWLDVISPEEARSGFSSNAVMAIIGVMILGRGLYKAGVTEKIAKFILRVAPSGRNGIISTVSMTVGTMSGFMQNIGAAALFLPVMKGISNRQNIPVSSLLMPMGFAALLGGTLTMVGTSSLVILNDLLANQNLETFGLMSVTPIGLALLAAGIGYFVVFGKFVFPSEPDKPDGEQEDETTSGEKLLNVWGLSDSIYTFEIPEDSPLVGENVEESAMGSDYNVNLLRVYGKEAADYEIWKNIQFEPGQHIVVQGRATDVERFKQDFGVELVEEEEKPAQDSRWGYIEVVIPARSELVGKTIREVSLGEKYNAQVVLFFSDSKVVEQGQADRKVKAGDTLVLHGKWKNLQFFKDNDNFITVTPLSYEPMRPEKSWLAITCFAAAIGVVFAFDYPISVGFLTGAVGMILGGVLTVEDAYRAVEWKVIFLISGLIPLGIAMENSKAAAFIAENLVGMIQGVHAFWILLIIGLLTTLFSLFMSNVAATVMLVPLVLGLTGIGGLSTEMLVLQVGVCAANSFIIPTHHVNALLMTPGGYRVKDYMKAGGILSLIFLFVSTSVLYFFY